MSEPSNAVLGLHFSQANATYSFFVRAVGSDDDGRSYPTAQHFKAVVKVKNDEGTKETECEHKHRSWSAARDCCDALCAKLLNHHPRRTRGDANGQTRFA